ncbi:unnamed protein product, partial [Oppiella nova]
IGVEFIRNDIEYRVYANKEVIVSGGAINSPQLLMLSGISPKYHLQSLGIPVLLDLPVGDNYVNHPSLQLNPKIRPEYLYLTNELAQINIKQLSQLYYEQGGVLAQRPFAALIYSTKNNQDKHFPNVNLFYHTFNGTLWTTPNMVRVKSRGTVRLQSTNPRVYPLLRPNFLTDPDDVESILDAARLIFYIFEKTIMAQYVILPKLSDYGCPVFTGRYIHECTEGLMCWIKYNSVTTYHVSGSCRMGSIDRPDVVVDPQLRVKYAKNLRVCDASVFPMVPNSNTASASITVGYKCSQFIKDCYDLK